VVVVVIVFGEPKPPNRSPKIDSERLKTSVEVEMDCCVPNRIAASPI
jgi:hypothetical protein